MKLKIVNKHATEIGQIDLPIQFQESVRLDLVKRAVLAIRANNRQPYGTKPGAGKRASAYVSKRRRAYKGTYGIGQSRTPRKILSKSGTRFNFVGAFAPQTVGGRRAHGPKATKIWTQKINETENRKEIRSALASTIIPGLVKARGHKIPNTYPFIITDEFNQITKTAELKKTLQKLGFKEELERAAIKKIRAGKGKNRGRKYKTKKSILIVTDKESQLKLSSANIPGVDFAIVENLNAELLAPGTTPGRATLYTESAIKKITEQKLFTKNYKGQTILKLKKESKKTKEKITKTEKTTKKKTETKTEKKELTTKKTKQDE